MVGPVGASYQHDDLDDLIAQEGGEGGVATDQVLHQEVAELRPLSETQRHPHLGHQILGQRQQQSHSASYVCDSGHPNKGECLKI